MCTFVCGDIHGAYKALIQCLERSGFDYEQDTLIQIGDCVDGYSQSKEVVEELLKIKNLIAIKGNHDETFNQFIKTGYHEYNWAQGGTATYDSYKSEEEGVLTIPKTHRDFFSNQILYHIDNNRIFVHGGFNRDYSVKQCEDPSDFYWNRDLWNKALCCGENQVIKTVDNFSEIFIGHTPTINWKKNGKKIMTPMYKGGVWNLDTGAGWGGKLTIMNIDTHEYYQSDLVSELYSNEKGRK